MASFYIEQFGCRATQADGAAIERQLRDRGLTAACALSSADVVVINTCTVTAAADAQARESIRKLHRDNPAARVIVTGCYAQRAPEELAALPGVSWVVGNSHKPQIADLVSSLRSPKSESANSDFIPVGDLRLGARARVSLQAVGEHAPPQLGTVVECSPAHKLGKILTGDILAHSDFLSAPVLGGESNHTRPTLKIQDGCNLRCAYCVIPFVRGKSRSLPSDEVVSEIRRLSDCGYREIVLSGINLGTYGRDLSPRVEFIDLLRRILDETSVERLRISSIEPLDVTQDLVALFASTDRIAEHFHMPLQSGCDCILAAMHRWYRTEHYARRVELIRESLPNAAIGADVIAGFPGESQRDHDATLAFIERLPFTYLHVFSYSQRPGTHAATMADQVPAATIKQRARELRALGAAKATVFRRSQIGRTLRVLTLRRDERDTRDAFTPGISSNYLRVQVPNGFESNLWLDVRISSEAGTALVGEFAAALLLPLTRQIMHTNLKLRKSPAPAPAFRYA